MSDIKDFIKIYQQAEDLGFNGVQFKRDGAFTKIILPITDTHLKIRFPTHQHNAIEFVYKQVQEYLDSLERLVSLADDLFFGGVVFVLVGGEWLGYCSRVNKWIGFDDFYTTLDWELYKGIADAEKASDCFAVIGEVDLHSGKDLKVLIGEVENT